MYTNHSPWLIPDRAGDICEDLTVPERDQNDQNITHLFPTHIVGRWQKSEKLRFVIRFLYLVSTFWLRVYTNTSVR